MSPHRLKRLWHFGRAGRWRLAGGLFAGLVYSITSGVGLPMMFKTLLPIFFGKESEVSPRLVETAKAWFGPDYVNRLLIATCIALPVVFLVRGIAAFANRYLVNQAGFMMLENLRVAVFARLQELPLAFYQQHNSGDLTARLMTDTEQLKNAVVNLSRDIIKQPFTLIAASGYLVYLSIVERSALFALIGMLSIPVCVLPIQLAARRLRKRARQLAKAGGELTSIVTESMQAPVEIRAYNLQKQQTTRFAGRVRDMFRVSMRAVFYQSITMPIVEFVSVSGFVAALYLGTRAGMDFATFSALGLALYLCYEPVKKMTSFQGLFKNAGAALERLEEILDAVDTVPAPAQPKPFPPSPCALEFHGVVFRYPTRGDTAPAALNGVSLRIEPGQVVALVGASGAGKSTFVTLIPRFYDPTEGHVSLGGVDLRELDTAALRQHIAVVPQMPALFNTTIAENIRIGRPEASDEEVRAAAARAFVADFIESLPDGYNTLVGERGAAVSGGQRQRIAIARAFLKDAPILILDEAASALDSESEAKIQRALQALVQGRVTFMIAHRFSSISLANRILVFEEGRVTGDGTPETLLQTHAVYRRLSELQRLG